MISRLTVVKAVAVNQKGNKSRIGEEMSIITPVYCPRFQRPLRVA